MSAVEPLENPKYYLSLVSVFRNEAPFLKEWIEFYMLIGVEHFYLFNHLSNDNFQQILQPYIDKGVVELFHVTAEPATVPEWTKIQVKPYNDAIKWSSHLSEWLIVVDTDEFLFPVKEHKLSNALKAYDKHAALSVNWTYYGSSCKNKEPGKLMIETLMCHSNQIPMYVKSIVKPRYTERFPDPHHPIMKPGYQRVSENHLPAQGSITRNGTSDIFRLNHYWSRYIDFLCSTKLDRLHIRVENTTRGKSDTRECILKRDQTYSVVENHQIAKYFDELRERM